MGKKQLSFLSSRTPKKTEEHHKQHATASPNLEGPQTITTPQEPPLSKEEILEKVRYSPLVEVYAEDIQRWSKIVYGRGNVLRKETEEILENPEIKVSLLKQIKENPASIHSLAGMKMFNFKTHRRKEAEQAVSHLYSAIDVYAEAIKHTYKNIGITISVGNVAVERNLQKSLDIQQEKASFSNEPLINTEKNQSPVGKYYAKIEHLSQLVYGNKCALQKQMEEVLEKPDMGERFLWMIVAHPTHFHKLAGRNICGFKNSDRIYAENHLTHLYDAFKNYTEAVKEARNHLLQKQEIQQKCADLSKNQQQEVKQKLQKTQESQRNTQPERSENAAAHAIVFSAKASLSNETIADLIKSKSSVQKCYGRVKYLSQIVYGDWHALQNSMEDILKNPAMGEQISQKVAKNPVSFHGLAGRSICGFKNTLRRRAEAYISCLCEAFSNYTEAVQESKKAILQEYEMQQHFIVSQDQKQEAEQKLQKPQERQYTQQHRVQQYKASSGKERACAL